MTHVLAEPDDIHNLVCWQIANNEGGMTTICKYQDSLGNRYAGSFAGNIPAETARSIIIYNRKKDVQHPKASVPPLNKKGLSVDEHLLPTLQI